MILTREIQTYITQAFESICQCYNWTTEYAEALKTVMQLYSSS
jgi:hypothetical protein